MPAWWNVPNALTLLRLAMLPWILAAVAGGRAWLAISLFTIAAVTDVADGYIARRFHLTTQVGAYLDPIADKCFLSGTFLALAWSGRVPWWLVWVILGRDLYILAGVALLMGVEKARGFPPSVWGKLSTFVQILTAAACLSHVTLNLAVTGVLARWSVWPCACFTVWSGVHYTWRAWAVGKRIDAVSAPE